MSASRKALGRAIRKSKTASKIFPKTAAAKAKGSIETNNGTINYRKGKVTKKKGKS